MLLIYTVSKHPTETQFMDLIDQNKGLIWKVCLFYAATETDRQDLYQDIILQAWKSYPGFRQESKFSTWLYRISLNTALFARRKYRPDIRPLPVELANSASPYSDNEPFEIMHVAIRALNEIEKSLVLLHLEGYNYDEMEKITGISGGTLRVKMSRIKQKLKNFLK